MTRALGMLLLGKRLAERDDHGTPVEDDDLLLLLNAGDGKRSTSRCRAKAGELLRRHRGAAAPVTNPYALEARSLVAAR